MNLFQKDETHRQQGHHVADMAMGIAVLCFTPVSGIFAGHSKSGIPVVDGKDAPMYFPCILDDLIPMSIL